MNIQTQLKCDATAVCLAFRRDRFIDSWIEETAFQNQRQLFFANNTDTWSMENQRRNALTLCYAICSYAEMKPRANAQITTYKYMRSADTEFPLATRWTKTIEKIQIQIQK